MKNITKQYQDLLEGKMSKANFMTNVRREFPQWISPVNTFDHAVSILKSKRILNESVYEAEVDRQLLNPEKAAAAVASEYPTITNQDEALSIIQKMMADAGIPSREIAGAVNDPDWPSDYITALHKMLKGGESLNEAEKKDPSIDQVDYRQLVKGTEFEMSKMPLISDENYEKAKQKAYKKLVKDPNAYRDLTVANYDEVEKKDKALRTQEVKKDNLADKANEMKTIKKDVKGNTQDSLGKKEKAKGNPEGVKMMKESSTNLLRAEMLKEFEVMPEKQIRHAKGHLVKTPDGKTGTIEELTPDGTATVQLEGGNKVDYQTNVLKKADEVVAAPVQSKEDKLKEIKDKLMKSLEEAGVLQSKVGGVTIASGKNDTELTTQGKSIEKNTGDQIVYVNTKTGQRKDI